MPSNAIRHISNRAEGGAVMNPLLCGETAVGIIMALSAPRRSFAALSMATCSL